MAEYKHLLEVKDLHVHYITEEEAFVGMNEISNQYSTR